MTYEYLLAGLPELKAGSDAPVSLEKLDELFDEQLRASDRALLDLLRAPMNEETLAQGLKAKNRFVREWFGFNQDMNNVLVASICRKHSFDVRKAIVGHNEVADILRTHTQQKDFGLSGVMDNLQDILDLAAIDNLMEREKRTDALRFAWLEDKTRFYVFSIELVLAYYLEAGMLQRWSALTVEQGEQVFRAMVADMKKGVQLVNE